MFYLDKEKKQKREKMELTKSFNKRVLGLDDGDVESDTPPIGTCDSPPLKKKEYSIPSSSSYDHLDTSFTVNEPTLCSAPLPAYSFTKKNIFYCVWWNVGQTDLQLRFKDEVVEIDFSLPQLTVEDLESILGEETVMNLPTEHSVKWVYQMPPNVKLEMSKDSIGKIETENFFSFKGKIVRVVSELIL